MKNTEQLSMDFSKMNFQPDFSAMLPQASQASAQTAALDAEEMDDRVYALRRTIAKNCIHLRKNAGVTQGDLANRIGLSQSHISYVESGLGNPSVGILAKISKGLEIELTELFIKSIWDMDHYSAESFSVVKNQKFELKKLAIDLPEGWDFQKMKLNAAGETQILPKKKTFRQFYFCTQGNVTIRGTENEVILKTEEGAAIMGSQTLKIINRCQDEVSEVIHLCYREK